MGIRFFIVLGVLAWGCIAEAAVLHAVPSLVWHLATVSAGVSVSDTKAVSGTVTGCTVSYRGRGQIRIWISADGGSTYAESLPGVALTGGFGHGSKLCWKADLSQGATLSSVVIDYRDDAGTVSGFGEPALSGYASVRDVTLTSSSKEDIFDREIALTVSAKNGEGAMLDCAGLSRNGLKDVRFALPNGTLLSQWRESIDGNTAKIWVRVPRFSAGKVSLQMFVGKVDDDAAGDPADVFRFYHDFSDAAKTAKKWGIAGSREVGEQRSDGFLLGGGTMRAVDGGVAGLAELDSSGDAATWDGTSVAVAAGKRSLLRSVRVRSTELSGLTVTQGLCEAADVPVFSGVTLTADGLLSGEGTYRSRQFVLSFVPRIAWVTGEGISVAWGSASAEEWSDGEHRYASRGMFVSSADVRLTARISGTRPDIVLEYRSGIPTVLDPAAGSTVSSGSELTIRWSADDYLVGDPFAVSVISTDGKEVFHAAVREARTCVWRVPTVSQPRAYIIRVSDVDDASAGVSVPVTATGAGVPGAGSMVSHSGARRWGDPVSWGAERLPGLGDTVSVSGTQMRADEPVSFGHLDLGDENGTATSLTLAGGATAGCVSVTVHRGASLILEGTRMLTLVGALTLKDGGVLTHLPCGESCSVAAVDAETIVVEKGAAVDVSGKGFAGGSALSSGSGTAPGSYQSNGSGSGGGHAGKGGITEPGLDAARTYGDREKPRTWGSSGGGAADTHGGAGGGCVVLTARGVCRIDGTISADGMPGGAVESFGGGGAGGSIMLTADRYEGEHGMISAKGGDAQKAGGGGGGYVRIVGGSFSGAANVNGGGGAMPGDGGAAVISENADGAR